MLIIVLFTIANLWEQPNCQMMDKLLDKEDVGICTINYYLALKKDDEPGNSNVYLFLHPLPFIFHMGRTSSRSSFALFFLNVTSGG